MTPRCYALVPCAGAGLRAGGGLPKQYAAVAGRSVVGHTLAALARVRRLHATLVLLATDDRRFEEAVPGFGGDRRWVARCGGATRALTVANGLSVLRERGAAADDWVMVHDAARPCVRHADIDSLLLAIAGHADGGLLALPLNDTVKRADHNGYSEETVARTGLWRALTPQVFRFAALRNALESAIAQGMEITDEASAMEASGARPRLVPGHADNIKITVPEDIALAELFLREQEREHQ
jgi:2-C-methyl-D-erythritol 4-phosphate cytidylyltransferase